MADLVGAVLELFVHGGKLAMGHAMNRLMPAKEREETPAFEPLTLEPLEGLRGLESLPPLEAAAGAGAAAAKPARTVSAPAPAGPSYSEEFAMAPVGIACWPCTDRHIQTVLITAEQGAAATVPQARQEAAATILAEVAVWQRYDLSADKLARTEPGRRAAVEAAIPHMRAAAACLVPPPGDLHLAWGAAGEAERFLRGAPKPLDVAEATERMDDTKGWIGHADTLPMPADAAPHLRDMRLARQRLAEEAEAGMGLTHAATLQCKDALRAAAVALTPDPGQAALATAAEHARAARKAFRGGALAEMRGRAKAPAQKVYRDVDLRIPEELRGALLQVAPADTASLLGATPQMRQAFAWLLQFDQACGVPVRVEDFPTIVEDGQALGTIRGAFYPLAGKNGAIEIGPSAASMRPQGLYTLTHENVHFIDHRQGCNPYDSTDVAYEDMPEELEADAGATLALLLAGDPEEDDFGRPIPEAEVRRRLRSLERRMTPQMIRRAEQAGRILAQALRGDPQGAAALAATCPR